MICDIYDAVKTFKGKLHLWETQIEPVSLSLSPSNVELSQFYQSNTLLIDWVHTEFTQCVSDFKEEKDVFELLRHPFAINVETAPVPIQTELLEPQGNGTLKTMYDSVNPAQFTRLQWSRSAYTRLQRCLCLAAHICARLCSLWRWINVS